MINLTGREEKALGSTLSWYAFLPILLFVVALMAPLAGYAEDINASRVLAPANAEKILARQFVVYAEKSGEYQLDILFSPGAEINSIEDNDERFRKEEEIHDKVFEVLKGCVLVYDLQDGSLVQVIDIPTNKKKKNYSSLYIIDEDELGELYPAVNIPHPGRYLIRPEIVSHYPEFSDYTLYFVRVRYK